MKWPQKGLYTYNVREGDSFILDEKAPPLPKLKTAAPGSAAYSTSPKVFRICHDGEYILRLFSVD